MGGAEGIVHVHVGKRGQLGGEGGVVGRLLGMEAQVLEQQQPAGGKRAGGGRDVGTDTVVNLLDRPVQQLGQPLGDRVQAQLGHGLPLGAAEV